MLWFTVYDIRTSNDLAVDNTLAATLAILTVFAIGCAMASGRRPRATSGRTAITALLAGFACLLAAVALVCVTAGADVRQHRAGLAAGRFTLLQGAVTAAKLVSTGKSADWEFELGGHWFTAPNQACPQHPADRIALAYVPAGSTHLADTILRLQTTRQCKLG